MDFADPQWFWFLLAVPPVVGAAAWLWRRRLLAMSAWASRGLWDRLLGAYQRRRLVLSVAFLALAITATILALTRPRWGSTEQQIERRGVDLVFVLDTSLSMATRDVAPSRLWVAQTLIRRLVQDLPGHRIALVQAEGDGVVMVPLTVDSAVVDLVLDAVQPGSLPKPGTELRPAIERAVNLFGEDDDKHRAIIVISDGEDHGTGLDKLREQLVERGVVLHAIGVGTPQGMPLELPTSKPGGPVEYKLDDAGKIVFSRLHEEVLESLSRETKGLYVRATSAAIDLSTLVERIDSMEQRSFGSETINTLEERFQWPIVLAILALVLHLAVAPFGAAQEGWR